MVGILKSLVNVIVHFCTIAIAKEVKISGRPISHMFNVNFDRDILVRKPKEPRKTLRFEFQRCDLESWTRKSGHWNYITY